MKILAVDDESLALEWLCECIREAAPEAEIIPFCRSKEALEYIRHHKIDVAFLDIQMGEMTGLELGKQIKIEQPIVNIIFCTAYSEHIYDAVTMVRCNGYLLKPFDAEQIKEELANLRIPMNYQGRKQFYVQCFGNFEVFADGEPVYFEVSKAKELLAYLIDRNGAVCTNDEISAVLWEDGTAHTSYLKKCKKNLLDTLDQIGCKEVTIHRWGVWQSIRKNCLAIIMNGRKGQLPESMRIMENIWHSIAGRNLPMQVLSVKKMRICKLFYNQSV